MAPNAVRRWRALGALAAALRAERDVLPRGPDAWSAFLELAAAHDLLPAVWVSQARAGQLSMPAGVAAAIERETSDGMAVPAAVLRRAYDRNVVRTRRLVEHGVEALGRLSDAGVRAVPLKGLHSLLAGDWSDPAARTMADLDVLVDSEQAPQAYELLRGAGYDDHPEPIGEHADHHLPMLCSGDVTLELHVEPLVSRWHALVPAAEMLQRATPRPTEHGVVLMSDDTDAFVHLVAHAQLQDETYALLGLPLRALLETAAVAPRRIRWDEVRARFAAAGVGHVLDAHLHATRHHLGAATLPGSSGAGARRAELHTRLVELGVAEPAVVAGWRYAVRVPRSFAAERMRAEFGAESGTGWLWRARARHAARRVAARLGRHDSSRAQ